MPRRKFPAGHLCGEGFRFLVTDNQTPNTGPAAHRRRLSPQVLYFTTDSRNWADRLSSDFAVV
jgi:hypothetical protein